LLLGSGTKRIALDFQALIQDGLGGGRIRGFVAIVLAFVGRFRLYGFALAAGEARAHKLFIFGGLACDSDDLTGGVLEVDTHLFLGYLVHALPHALLQVVRARDRLQLA
jgi:hypothetical protein